jgi:hypothetical protein
MALGNNMKRIKRQVNKSSKRMLVNKNEGGSISANIVPLSEGKMNKGKLILEGSMTLLEADTIKTCLHKTFDEFDDIDIHLLNIDQFDLTSIQLLAMFKGFYPNKKVIIDSDVPFDMKLVIERAGFGSLMFNQKN